MEMRVGIFVHITSKRQRCKVSSVHKKKRISSKFLVLLRVNIDLLSSTEEEEVWLEGGRLAAAVRTGYRAKEAPVK